MTEEDASIPPCTPWIRRYAVDAASACTAALLVSPLITIVDRAIIENASGVRPLRQGLKSLSLDFLQHPMSFLKRREFMLIFGLYAATYTAANSIDTTCTIIEKEPTAAKFLGTTAVNMTLCVAKDRAFTRMFGAISPSSVPLPTYALFALRDSLTVAASFTFPPIVSKQLQHEMNCSVQKADVSAQLLCPAAVQFISTPLHLLGLDLYNHKEKKIGERVSFLTREYWKSALARIARIGPAFGIGGISNKYFRDTWNGLLFEQ